MYLFDDPQMDIPGAYLKSSSSVDEICNFNIKINNHILVSSTISMNIPLKMKLFSRGKKVIVLYLIIGKRII